MTFLFNVQHWRMQLVAHPFPTGIAKASPGIIPEIVGTAAAITESELDVQSETISIHMPG
jgi:hypothetical protein